MHVEAWMCLEPIPDGRGFAGLVVVADQVHIQALGDLAVNLDQETAELGGAVLAVKTGDHGTVRGVQCGKQSRGDVPEIAGTTEMPAEYWPKRGAKTGCLIRWTSRMAERSSLQGPIGRASQRNLILNSRCEVSSVRTTQGPRILVIFPRLSTFRRKRRTGGPYQRMGTL